MAERSSVATPRTTVPVHLEEARRLAAELATLPTDELARLLRVNRRIAAENHLRYRRFHDSDTPALPALTAYTGIVFKRIDPASFSAADLEYAQEHLNITSFLYGVLRPLDAIRPYRLEGDAVLPGHDEQTLFAYWHERPTRASSSNASTRRASPPPTSNTPRSTSTSRRSSTECSARWTPSAPTGSKATPCCPATTNRRSSPTGTNG